MKHISGDENILADKIIRIPAGLCERETRDLSKEKRILVAAINLSIKVSVGRSLKDFSKYQARDKILHEIEQSKL
jgi:hypothetical protein